MKLILAILILACSNAFAFDKLNTQDLVLESAYLTTWYADYTQTMQIKTNPGYYECNRILGKHPSNVAINRYFIVGALLHVGVVKVLPSKYRPYFQYLTISYEVGIIKSNYNLGVKVRF